MKKTKKAVKSVYVGSDPAKFIWSNRTHRSTSEAFRDADYATPMWRCENDWDRAKEYIGWGLMWAVLLYSLYLLATAFEVAVS
jgi:hypothetical protein